MRRVISLYLPNWPIDRLYRTSPGASPAPDQPLILVSKVGRRRVVAALNAAAHGLGVRKSMPVTKAQAVVPELILRDADLAGDAAALERLAFWALRYAPIVAADAPDGLVIDSTGTDHLHGSEEAMLDGMIMRFAASGITARAAIAGSWGAAHALARFRAQHVFVAASGEEAALLHPLPLVALRLSADHIEGLHTLGFERIGDLIEAPRAPLTLRFGPEIGRRLDQALGTASEPFDPVRSPDLIEVRRAFGEPIGAAETIARYISKLVQELVIALEARGLGARRLDLLCHRVDNRIEVIRVGTAQPVRDAKRLTRLVCDRIEKIDPGFGIELMVLAATIAEPLDARQTISSLVEEPEADCADLIDLLANRIGERRLYRFAPVQSDVPERSVRRIPANAPDDGESWSFSWPRPPRLLASPELIETVALLPDHPPVTFTWRGQRRRVKRADGPERVFGEWWERDAELAAVRDYFQVEDEGGERFWIYRAGDGEDPATGSHRWFIHGIFA